MIHCLKTAGLAAAFALGASAATALTVNYDQFQEFDDLGAVTVASLEAVQDGNDVQFTLSTDSALVDFVQFLALNYAGETAAFSATQVSGATFDTFRTGTDIRTTFGGSSFNVDVGYSFRALMPGNSSVFTVANADLDLFDFNDSAVQISTLEPGGCDECSNAGFSIYSGSVVPDEQPELSAVPLPAAGWLLVGAFGGLAAVRRRRKS